MLTGVYETLRSAGPTARARARRGARRSRSGSPSCARRRATLAADPGATERQRAAATRGARPPVDPERLLDLGQLAALRRAAAPSTRRARAASRPRSRPRRRATASCSRSCSTSSPPSTRPARSASRRSTSRTSSCSRATCCATTRASARRSSCASARSWSTSSRTRTRSSASWSTCSAAPRREGRVLRRRRVPVDLRVPPRRRRGVPRAARGGRAAAAADARTTARGPRCCGGQLPLRRRVRRRLPAARLRRRVPRSGLRASGRAARHRQGVVPRHGEHWRAGRGAARRAARPRARRRGRARRRARSCSCSRPAPTPSGTRRSSARSGCRPTARPDAGYFGQQQVVDLLLYLRLLRNRYDDEALVTVLALAVRRRLERRARARSAATRAAGRCSPGSSARCRRRSTTRTSS